MAQAPPPGPVPRLQQLALDSLAVHIQLVQSLDGVPEELCILLFEVWAA